MRISRFEDVCAQGKFTRGSSGFSPETKNKCSNIVFGVTVIACSLDRSGSQLLMPAAQSHLQGVPYPSKGSQISTLFGTKIHTSYG